MARRFPVLDPNVKYADEYLKTYGRNVSIPQIDCKEAFFHPTLTDHIITINQINCDSIPPEDIQALMHDRVSGDFHSMIENTYLGKANGPNAAKKIKMAHTSTFRKESDDGNSMPEEPATQIFDEEGFPVGASIQNPPENPETRVGEQFYSKEHDEESKEVYESERESEGEASESYEASEGEESEEETANADDIIEAQIENNASGSYTYEESDSEGSDEYEDSDEISNQMEGGQPEHSGKKKKKNKKKKQIMREQYFARPLKTKGKYEKIDTDKTKAAKKKKIQQQQNYLNKAVDMFLEEKNTLFSYKGYDRDVNPLDDNEEPVDDLHRDWDGNLLDHYDKERYGRQQSAMLRYSPLPKFYGMNYVPPIFRHKFEICIWKVNPHNVAKIKNSYFTPQTKLKDPTFEVNISLDKETLTLYTENGKGDLVVLVFDNDNLTKLSEFTAKRKKRSKTWKRFERKLDTEEYMMDLVNPKIATWNMGKYMFIGEYGTGTGAEICWGFNIFDTEEKKEVSFFSRIDHGLVDASLYDIYSHPGEPDILVMVFKDKVGDGEVFSHSVFKVIEANMIENTIKEACEITIEDCTFIKIGQTLEDIFVCCSNPKNSRDKRLYRIDYGDSYDFTSVRPPKVAKLGASVKRYQIIEDRILVYFENKDGTFDMGIYKNKEVFEVKNTFDLVECERYSYLSETNEVLCLPGKKDSAWQIMIVSDERDTIDESKLELVEDTALIFEYPNVMYIKGGVEIIVCNIVTQKYKYVKLPSPIIDLSYQSHSPITSIAGLIDCGTYFATATLKFDNNDQCVHFYIDNHFMYKGAPGFPTEKLLTYLGDGTAKIDSEDPEPVCILHFVNHLVLYSLSKAEKIMKTEFNYKKNNVIWEPLESILITFNKDSKKIHGLETPFDFKKKGEELTLYTSQGVIKNFVRASYDLYYIVDELKYLKKLRLEKVDKTKKLKLQEEFFVSKDFVGSGKFSVYQGLMVTGNKGIKLQKRGYEIEDMNTTIEIEPKKVSDIIATDYCMLLKYKPALKTPGKVTCVPHFTESQYPLVLSAKEDPYSMYYDDINISKTFFTYAGVLKEEYIVSFSRAMNSQEFTFHFMKSNGKLLHSKTLKMEPLENQNVNIKKYSVSPNGRYFSFITQCYGYPTFNVYDNQDGIERLDSATDLKDKKKKERKYFDTGNIKSKLFIYEIVPVRRKKALKNLKKLIDTYLKEYTEATEGENANKTALPDADELKKKVQKEELLFDLKKVREVDDVYKYVGVNVDIRINDVGCFFPVHNYDNRICYDKFEFTNELEKALGKNPEGEYYKIQDYRVKALQTGFMYYLDKTAVYQRLKSTPYVEEDNLEIEVTSSKPMPIKFEIGTDDIFIENVYDCQDYTKVLFVLFNTDSSTRTFLVWDLVSNSEVHSTLGYILTADICVNLDTGLPNYFFDHVFKIDSTDPEGYTINYTEEIILESQSFIMKTLYSEAVALDNFMDGTKEIAEGNFTIADIKFQIEGNTAIHLFSADLEQLKLVLEYLYENMPGYLNAILEKNKHGETPISISIAQDTPKNTDLLLKYLAKLEDNNYSQLIYKDFPYLIKNGLKSFHSYLDTCTFQTSQMKNVQYLSLPGGETHKTIATSSAILERDFFEVHTKQGRLQKQMQNKRMDIRKGWERFDKLKTLQMEREKQKAKNQGLKYEEDKLEQKFDNFKLPPRGKSFRQTKAENTPTPEDEEEDYEQSLDDLESYDEDESDESLEEEGGKEEDKEEDKHLDSSRHINPKQEGEKDTKQMALQKRDAKNKELTQKEKDEQLYEEAKKDNNGDIDIEAEYKEIIRQEENLEKMEEKHKEELDQGLKRYDVRAIEFNWLFDEENGTNFLKALAYSNNLEVYSLDLVKDIVLFLWSYYRNRILMFIFLPFMIYFITFLLYATWITREEDLEDDKSGPWYIVNVFVIIFLFMFIIYNTIYEALLVMNYKLDYFRSFWNILNVVSIILNVVVLITDLADMKDEDHVPLLAVAVLIMWIKLCFFGRMYMKTAWIIKMVYAVTADMGWFVLVFAIMVIGFGNAFYIVAKVSEPRFTGETFWAAIRYSYRTGLGDFLTDDYPGDGYDILIYVIWFLGTFLMLIVLLNMLIAIISDIFAKVHENINSNLLNELVVLMVESELLISRKRLFKGMKYIVVVSQETGNTGQNDSDNKLAIIKHTLKTMESQIFGYSNDSMSKEGGNQNMQSSNIENKLKEYIANRIDQKSSMLEASIVRHLNAVSEKISANEASLRSNKQF